MDDKSSMAISVLPCSSRRRVVAVGIARRARDEVLTFGSRRRLYGDKLLKLQDYRFRISEMEMDIAAARALVEASARRHDNGLDHGKEASIAKLYAGKMVLRVTEAASVMLGSEGYTGSEPHRKALSGRQAHRHRRRD